MEISKLVEGRSERTGKENGKEVLHGNNSGYHEQNEKKKTNEQTFVEEKL